MVLSMVDRYREDRRLGHVQSREIPLQIRRAITAAEFDDGDALALPGAGWEVVQRGKLGRREGCRGDGRRVPLHIPVRGESAKMRVCLRPIVETEHRSDHPVQFVWQMYRSGPAAIGPAVMFELLQVYLEGGIELGDRPGEHDSPPARVLRDDGK